MVHEVKRWIRAGLVVVACLAADAASAKTSHGTVTGVVEGVEASGFLSQSSQLSVDINLKYVANDKTLNFTAKGKRRVTNLSGLTKTFIDQPGIGIITAFPVAVTDIHTIYTVKANGECELTVTAMIVTVAEPADSDDECVDECIDHGSEFADKGRVWLSQQPIDHDKY
jgi:hypothetical protein